MRSSVPCSIRSCSNERWKKRRGNLSIGRSGSGSLCARFFGFLNRRPRTSWPLSAFQSTDLTGIRGKQVEVSRRSCPIRKEEPPGTSICPPSISVVVGIGSGRGDEVDARANKLKHDQGPPRMVGAGHEKNALDASAFEFWAQGNRFFDG